MLSPFSHVSLAMVSAAAIVGCAAGRSALAPPDVPPATAPAPVPIDGDPVPAPAEAADDPAADLLTVIEESGRTLAGFTAAIYYETEDALLGQKVIRQGSILFRRDPDTGNKSFAILFDFTIVNRRKDRHPKHIIFRDGWLVEIDHENRQFVKRQVVAPGEDIDPLRLGEGPIPLPIDQTRESVLSRFVVSLIDLPEDGPLARLRGGADVDGLHLVPKAGAPVAKDFASVDLFFDRETRLPAGVTVIKPNGDRKTARLTDLRRNPPFDAEDLAKLDIAEPRGEGWRIDVRRLEGR